MQVFLRYCEDVPKQKYGDVRPPFYQIDHSELTLAPRLNTFLELKMENERLQHRVRELRAQKAPFLQTPPSSTTPPLMMTALTLSSNFGGTTSSEVPIGPTPSTVPDHSESVTSSNPNPVTRNLDAAGFQEGDQDEPAKKKVYYIHCSDQTDDVAT